MESNSLLLKLLDEQRIHVEKSFDGPFVPLCEPGGYR